ncbi:MAG: hypothetical protein G3M78_09160 [Candidatus Nitrohelix vancouverensis]|uniref:Uncharacterized protein n=1 Tax=Candidatus Nitrohelix vancouverensis TaxID=2705534 RepID=A0A7T0C2W5_9BACT|nr:MAG: hypothetical protein G3M78_09160 [Candidatus Nitrohelix vancouverensis]
MCQIKDDLICEIIRISQTNLLDRKRIEGGPDSGNDMVVNWVRSNAKQYRENFSELLESYPASELGSILQKLTETGKDLGELLGLKFDRV